MKNLLLLVSAASLAVALGALPATASAQACPPLRRGELPEAQRHPQATKILVPTAHGDGKLGADFGYALRARLHDVTDDKVLWVIPCQTIDTLMARSGYKPDSALGLSDLGDLGHSLGAGETIDGRIWKTPDGQTHVAINLYLLNNIRVREQLPEIVGKDNDDVAAKVATAYLAARKEFDPYTKCYNLSRDGKGEAAVAAANEAVAANPNGIMPRICRMNALTLVPSVPKDSIVAAAKLVLATDSTSSTAQRAVGLIADAYRAGGDTSGAVPWYIRFYDMDRSNVQNATTVIGILAQSGAPDRALPIIDTVLARNPTNRDLRDTRLRILLRQKRYKEAYVAFEDLVKVDTAAASLDNYQRMIGTAQADSNPQMVLQYLASATKKFSNDAQLLMAYSTYLKDAGQLQQALEAAKRAVAADPKVRSGYAWVLQLYGNLNEPDSTLAFARKALAAGGDTAAIDAAVLRVVAPAIQKAQADSSGALWQPALDLTVRVDSIAPSQDTKFYIGVASIQIAKSLMAVIPDHVKTDKSRACSELGQTVDMANQSFDAMTSGGGGRRDMATATTIVQAVPNIRSWVAQTKASLTTGGFVCK